MRMLRKLRRSSRVTLVLAGMAALSGCSDERQDVYKSREDCLADWGNKPEDCTRATSGAHASSGYWYGPRYSHTGFGSGWSRSTRSGSHAISSSSVSRGGFGSSAHSSGG
jgi:uncharacterized protein YgiB involved in biofilm formation